MLYAVFRSSLPPGEAAPPQRTAQLSPNDSVPVSPAFVNFVIFTDDSEWVRLIRAEYQSVTPCPIPPTPTPSPLRLAPGGGQVSLFVIRQKTSIKSN